MLMQIILAKVLFKNCALFTECIRKINDTQVDNAKDNDIVMPMYNLIKYSDNYSKIFGSSRQYCKDILVVNNDGNMLILMELMPVIYLTLK